MRNIKYCIELVCDVSIAGMCFWLALGAVDEVSMIFLYSLTGYFIISAWKQYNHVYFKNQTLDSARPPESE